MADVQACKHLFSSKLKLGFIFQNFIQKFIILDLRRGTVGFLGQNVPNSFYLETNSNYDVSCIITLN